jgi:hypothetical protein
VSLSRGLALDKYARWLIGSVSHLVGPESDSLSAISDNGSVFYWGDVGSETWSGCEARWVNNNLNLHRTL